MSIKEKQGFGLYFLFAFGLAWLLQVYASLLLIRDGNATAYQALLAVSMFCPLAATLLVKKVFLHQPTGIGWKVQGKRRYWLAAWFGPAVFTVLAAVLYLRCSRIGWTSPAAGWQRPTAARWTRRPCAGAGRIQPQLHAGNRSVRGHTGSAHQYVRSFG